MRFARRLVTIPDRVNEQMKKHENVNWSAVVTQAVQAELKARGVELCERCLKEIKEDNDG